MRIDFSQFRLIGIRSLTIPANIGVCGEPVKELDALALLGWYAESQQVLEHAAVHPAERAVALGCMAGDEDQRRLRGFRW